MPKLRATRAICVLLPALALVLSAMPAQASTVSGSARAGFGGSSCNLSVSCAAFATTCTIGPANDIDASVRAANVGGQRHNFTWNADWRMVTTLVVYAFNKDCDLIGQPVFVFGSGTITLPVGTMYVGVQSSAPFVNLTWSMTRVL